jgi:2-polyprenyl-3-methyl-5-hydroxy-6-metoxy-1,4-benzoquinol methylase
MRVVECAVCGLGYLNPRPIDSLIGRLYEEAYFTGIMRSKYNSGLNISVRNKTKNKVHRPIEIIEDRFLGVRNKQILEIGCATGDLMLALRAQGADVHGLEISEYAAELARKRSLDVITGTIDDISHLYDVYDIIMAFEVIEHLTNPAEFLSAVSRLLKPNGILLMSTPNYHGAIRYGNDWSGFNYSFEHIHFFSIEVLRKMAIRSNLKLEYWETSLDPTGPPYGLSFVKRQINKVWIICMLSKDIGVKKTIKRISGKYPLYFPYGNGRTITALFQKKGAAFS